MREMGLWWGGGGEGRWCWLTVFRSSAHEADEARYDGRYQ